MDNKLKTAIIALVIAFSAWIIQDVKQTDPAKTQAWATIALALGFVTPSPFGQTSRDDGQSTGKPDDEPASTRGDGEKE